MAQGFCHEVCRMMRIRQNNLGHLRQFGQSQNLVGSQDGVNCGAVSIFPLSLISLIWFKLSGLFVVLLTNLSPEGNKFLTPKYDRPVGRMNIYQGAIPIAYRIHRFLLKLKNLGTVSSGMSGIFENYGMSKWRETRSSATWTKTCHFFISSHSSHYY